MRFLRLPSVLHGGEVHTLDINSDNTKLVTGGKDNRVSIWNLEDFVLSCRDQEDGKGIPDIQPIDTLLHHQHLVNIVKWNPKVPYMLVSADIEGNLYLKDQQEPRKIFPFPGFDQSTVEPVVDLTWSNDGRLIAWSTADGKTNLIDIERNTYQELTTLTHQDKLTVQRSVAFDPTNNYLITLGDDTLIYLYQYAYDSSTNDYQFRLINKISRLINKNALNVHYKRISWSPDGELLSVPTASKNQTSLISLISRSNNWQNRISLVGHGLTCECVKFSPKIYTGETSDPQTNLFNVIATAGSDKTLSVWNTSKDSPIFLLKEVADKPIVDICWDKTGRTLLVSSLDGHICIMTFNDNELGYEITENTFDNLSKLENEFVKPLNHKYEHDQPTNRRSGNVQIEMLDQKAASSLIEDKSKGESVEANKVPDAIIETTTDQIDAQIKGYIEPEFPPPPDTTEPEAASKDLLHSAMNTRSKANTLKQAKIKNEKPLSLDKQKTTTKNGKRRIQPMLLSNNGSSINSEPLNTASSSPGAVSTTSKSLMEFDKPSYSVSDEFYKQTKRLKTNDDQATTKKLKRELEPVKFIGSAILNPSTSFAKVRFSVPKVRLGFQLQSKLDDEVFVLDIKNGIGNETKPSRITYFKKDKQIWCDFIPRYIHLAAEGSMFWAISTADGQILTYSHTSGKRILPPIVLGSPISFLESHSSFLMAVTSVGEVYVWDLALKKIQLNTNMSPLLELNNKFQEDGLSKTDNITMCAVTSSGIPLVTLSNGSGYLFNKDLGIWQTITESWWSFGSHYWDSNDESKKMQSSNLIDDEQSIIELLEHKTNEEIVRKTRTGRGKFFNKISKNMIMKEGFENLENTISISHLENRILCCELLGEFRDFHKFFITYVKRICELGFKAKLYEICDQLLGPEEDLDTEEGPKWEAEICGLKKHDLLREVILSCAKNRDAQRILIHFGKKIGVVDESEV